METDAKIAKFIMQPYGYDVQSLAGGLKVGSRLEHNITNFEISGNRVEVIFVKRLGKGCASYIVCSGREGAVIDPVFPIDYYLKLAEEHNIKFIKVYDTHQHADHVSAGKELADKTGADFSI